MSIKVFDLGLEKLTLIPDCFNRLTKSTSCFLAIKKTPFSCLYGYIVHENYEKTMNK
jgi:hypothetical protein